VGGPTKGFRVDPDKLSAVADRVKRLHDSVSLDLGHSGNLVDFQDAAKADSLVSALQSFWTGDDVFASAYGEEHQGVVTTFQQLQSQLQILEQTCRGTAEQYQHHDQASRQDVIQSDGGGQDPNPSDPHQI
jgi:uncharacterized protein YukE